MNLDMYSLNNYAVDFSGGKRYASGNGNALSGVLTVTGLSFRPMLAVVWKTSVDTTYRIEIMTLFDTGFPYYNGGAFTCYRFQAYNIVGTYGGFAYTNNTITNSGFVASGLTTDDNYTWIAYE